MAAAAQLNTLGVSNLVIDTYKRVGDNWRLRYSSLSLHDPVYANHLPFYPFPSNWPVFTPAGKLANFLESYVDVLEVNVWTASTLDPKKTKFNESTKKWDVSINRTRADGKQETREFSVKHVVLATGLGGGQPKMPAPFKGQTEWKGTVVHSSKHSTGADWKGKRAMVVGACTSAHDVSHSFDLHWLVLMSSFVSTLLRTGWTSRCSNGHLRTSCQSTKEWACSSRGYTLRLPHLPISPTE